MINKKGDILQVSEYAKNSKLFDTLLTPGSHNIKVLFVREISMDDITEDDYKFENDKMYISDYFYKFIKKLEHIYFQKCKKYN